MTEFPSPVPGPSTPRVCFGLTFKPLREIKLSSSNSNKPYELAMKSFRKVKWWNPRFFSSTSPLRVPHFWTFDKVTMLSSTGPATPKTAISG